MLDNVCATSIVRRPSQFLRGTRAAPSPRAPHREEAATPEPPFRKMHDQKGNSAMNVPNHATHGQDANIVALGFTGADRYNLVRIFRDGGPSNTADAVLLDEYTRRDAESLAAYNKFKIHQSKQLIVAALIGIALLLSAPFGIHMIMDLIQI